MAVSRNPRVVIVGAGFGGLKAARVLARSGVDILLIDRNNYHTFIPLLYQVAAAELKPEQIAYPVRKVFRKMPNARFLRAEVKQVDFQSQVVETDGPAIPYDFLVLATGSQVQYLGVPGAKEYALTMNTLEEAVALRNHILWCFEQAVRENDPIQRQQLLTLVIVGGGPTGVELAGALIELIQGPLVKDYPTLNIQQVRVILLQAGDRLLADLPQRLGEYTQKQLRNRGVKVHLQSKVSKVTPETVYLQDGTAIFAKTIIWVAGVEATVPPPAGKLSPAAKQQVAVLPTLQLPKHPQVYVIGDSAYLEDNGQPLPSVAPVAIQQGEAVAQNIKRQLRDLLPQPFRYKDKGRAAIIARNAGVVHMNKLAFTGFPAWLLWLGIHLYYLPGVRNRLGVLLSWVCDYWFCDRSVRLILPKPTPLASPTRSIVANDETI
ncbi:MAG: NAD(P)/FAD-dependent oxidoreductase [Cyanobacteriota bacterium]